MVKYKIISFDKIPSTQEYALKMIADGKATDKTAVLAEAQSAGRGRYKRKWVSHHGNLYVSFIFLSPERDPKLAYEVAVAITETLLSFGLHPKIKWPNDILIDGKKISGTLIEYAGKYVVVGIGININTNPTVKEYQTTKISDYVSVDKNEVLNRLIKNLDRRVQSDFKDTKNKWMQYAEGLDRIVTYRGEDMELIGLSENGALVLRGKTDYVFAYGDEISFHK